VNTKGIAVVVGEQYVMEILPVHGV
jgi:hypothetical protein